MICLDLFSGIGGFSLAGQWVWGEKHKIHSFIEINPFCQKVLKKHWPNVLIHDDIRTYKHDGTKIDLLTGGFPCQPFSVAGKRRGKEDDRYLWPEMLRVIAEVKPTWIVGENVTGIINMELDKVLSDLESEGYETQTFIVPACAVDAPHRRDRVWIVAHSEHNGRTETKVSKSLGTRTRTSTRESGTEQPKRSGSGKTRDEVLADTCQSRTRMETHRSSRQRGQSTGTLESEILRQKNRKIGSEGINSGCENVADAECIHDDSTRHGTSKDGGQQSREAQIFRNGCEWLPESEFCRISNEFSEGLDEDRLTKTKGHDSMGLTQNKGEYHATSEDARSRKILPSLREEDVQETIRRNIRGSDEIQEEKILRSVVYGGGDDTRQSDTCSSKEKSNCFQGRCLRILWNGKEFKYSSQRFEPSEQREIKLDDVMCFLSYVMALDARESQEFSYEKAEALQRLWQGISEIKTGYVPKTLSEIQKIWRSLSDEETDWLILRIGTGNPFCAEWPGVPRVATGIPRRVDRLRSLGNAVVPQVVMPIMQVIKEIENK